MTDVEIACIQCGTMFTWEASEQRWYAAHGYTHQPKRCRACQRIRRDREQERTPDARADREQW